MIAQKLCVQCKREYTATSPTQNHCSMNCKRKSEGGRGRYNFQLQTKDALCKGCGKTFTSYNRGLYHSEGCRMKAVQARLTAKRNANGPQ